MLIIRLLTLIIMSILTSSCTNQLKNERFFYSLDWEQDVYNIIYSHFDYVDDLEFWIRNKPQYVGASPYQSACIEVKLGINDAKFYKVNLSLYTMSQIASCNLFENKNGQNGDKGNEINQQEIASGSNHLKESDSFNENYSDKPIYFAGDINSLGQGQNADFALNNNYNGKKIYFMVSDLFPVNKTQLTLEGKNKLTQLVIELSKISVSAMTIYGVSDSTGDYLRNKKLASERANSVYQYMKNVGLGKIPVTLKGSVENHENTRDKRAQQRRFVIELGLN